jgi:flavin reductase
MQADPGAVDGAQFRAAMARVAAAVSVVTTDGPAGPHGLTVSAMCSVSDDPPSLLVCVNRAAKAGAIIKTNRTLCVNVLSAGQEPVAAEFSRAGLPAADRFKTGDWSRSPFGDLVLGGALVSFSCFVDQAVERGSHSILICAVRGVVLDPGCAGVVYYDRSYRPMDA